MSSKTCLNKFVFVNLNNFSQNLSEHVQQVQLVLCRLLENKLYMKAEKCEFNASTVSFLGFIISNGQLQADPVKIKTVTNWKTPFSHKNFHHHTFPVDPRSQPSIHTIKIAVHLSFSADSFRSLTAVHRSEVKWTRQTPEWELSFPKALQKTKNCIHAPFSLLHYPKRREIMMSETNNFWE